MVYSDLDADEINRLPDTAVHRNVDLMVLSASPKVKTHIILPPTVYGIADHALAQKGISNPFPGHIPLFIRYSIDRGQAGMVGRDLVSAHARDFVVDLNKLHQQLRLTISDAQKRYQASANKR